MREGGVGRVLVASLHQAIADVLPTRLAFYESWLNTSGLRHGTIGLAPLYAVLSFLRQEGDAYARVTTRAGEYAAEWTLEAMRPSARATIRALPPALRRRVILRRANALVRTVYDGSRATTSRIRGGTAQVELRASVFCSVREKAHEPLCRFYAAAFEHMLRSFGLPASVTLSSCRGTGDATCVLMMFPTTDPAADSAEAA
jgi:bacteriochlorophyll 4-vinyl reductase